MADNEETLREYERLLDLEVKSHSARQDLRDRVQDKSLEQADAIMGLVSQQQAAELARKLVSDPN